MFSGRKKLALQLMITAFLGGLVLRQLDMSQYRDLSLTGPVLAGLLLGVLLFNLSKIAGAVRLNIYQRHVGLSIGEIDNLKLYYAGMYLNLALPGGIGGDGYKILVLRRQGAASGKVLVGITLFDRFSGLLALLLLGCALVPFLGLTWLSHTVHAWVAGCLTIVVALVLAHRCWLKMRWPAIFCACCCALVVQALQLACMAAIIAGLGVPLGQYPQYLAVFLASSIAAVLPVTIGGLGMRELTFVYGLRLLGLGSEVGVLAAIVFFLITAGSSLIGAALLPGSWETYARS
ncbi:lysylphosphatidylglycerol synthase transmembrane domain-containing protein [Massilia timonae]|nr:lysylphosphatidylglycerol synthase transmembrane domain-containing protein [Massilia timonae]